MKKKLFILALFFIFFKINKLYCLENDKVKVFEPKVDKMLVTRSSVIIVGERYDKNIKIIKISINSNEYEEKLTSDVFHILVKLFPGENNITICYSSKICYNIAIYYKKERDFSEVAKQFPKYIFHMEKTKEFCEKCHIIDANKGKKNVCYIYCHKNIIEKKVTKAHGPVGEGACLACHDPDGVSSGYAPLISGGKLCYTCHQSVIEGKYPHAAAKMADCMGCHDPHGSEFPFFIKESEKSVCFRCHTDMGERSVTIYNSTRTKILRTEVYTVKYQHVPVKEGNCLKCHDPHVSDFGRAHLRKRTSVLCKSRECHLPIIDKFDNHFHVYDVIPASGAPVKLPKDLRKDEYNNVVCYSCHDPHGSNYKGFLKKPYDQICVWCHDNMPKVQKLL
ncbi:hypothetical protein HY745_09760 [Candidatus Desantisbacteria bacterium]|nr:hypothetical protein [Candidatus Desantisbacteria bacterium]